MRVNAASLDIRDATTSTPGTLNDLTTDLIMTNNNNRCDWREGEWMRGLGFGFTNPVRTGGVLDVCLCCGGDVGGEWVGGLEQGM